MDMIEFHRYYYSHHCVGNLNTSFKYSILKKVMKMMFCETSK
jgi:hypothetical protein